MFRGVLTAQINLEPKLGKTMSFPVGIRCPHVPDASDGQNAYSEMNGLPLGVPPRTGSMPGPGSMSLSQ